MTWYFQVPEGEWALITACIVLFEYTTVGGVLTKSYLRFLATFTSAIYSILVIYFFDNNPLVNIIAAIAGLFLYSYFFMDGKQSYVGILGSVTLTIMLFNYNNIDAAILRPFNIIIGIIIAVVTLRFFYPEYARDRVMKAQADFILNLIQMLQNFLDTHKTLEVVKAEYLDYENKLIAGVASFNRYIEEAKIETKKMPLFITGNISIFGHAKRIYRLLSVLIYHLATDEIRTNSLIRENINEIIQRLETMRSCVLDPKFKKPIETEIHWDQSKGTIGLEDTQNPAQHSIAEYAFVISLFEGIINEIKLFTLELANIQKECQFENKQNKSYET